MTPGDVEGIPDKRPTFESPLCENVKCGFPKKERMSTGGEVTARSWVSNAHSNGHHAGTMGAAVLRGCLYFWILDI